MPVSYHRRKDIPFTKQEFDLQDNDQIYLFSDGMVDQFGGENRMKFLSKNFRELLLNIHTNPMTEQKKLILKSFHDWKGDLEQIDDVLIIGLKYSSIAKVKEEKDKAQKKVLIAEDTDVNYFFLVEALKAVQDIQVERAKDGVEAVKFCKENKVALVLMDINMPRMNGYEATKRIKKENKNIPIIVQTAMHFGQEMEDSEKAGADDFISKPIDLKSFIAKIKQYV
jgi:CheY-like chemotaxis protein